MVATSGVWGRGPTWASGSPCCLRLLLGPPAMLPSHQHVQSLGTRRATVSISFGYISLRPAQPTPSPAPAGLPLSSQTFNGSHCPLKKDPAPLPSRKPHPHVYPGHLPLLPWHIVGAQ